jgi:adenylyltransferase/sulfurtransferase
MKRYTRQSAFARLGIAGQEKLLKSKVAVVGIGALGTVIANNLARAGVGHLRLIDRDFVELHNLHRQVLFTEKDAAEHMLKALAAKNNLVAVNSDITVEAVMEDFNAQNALSLVTDMDLVLDGTDNRETRLLINEACCKANIPWIYGGVTGSTGTTMNIIPGKTACYHCLAGETGGGGTGESCVTAGVLNMATGLIANVESAEAVKILIASQSVRSSLLLADVWENSFQTIEMQRRPGCTVCEKGEYALLDRIKGSRTSELCGQDAVQIIPETRRNMDFEAIAQALEKVCDLVHFDDFTLHLKSEEIEIDLFRSGRAIIRNAGGLKRAKSIYTGFFG